VCRESKSEESPEIRCRLFRLRKKNKKNIAGGKTVIVKSPKGCVNAEEAQKKKRERKGGVRSTVREKENKRPVPPKSWGGGSRTTRRDVERNSGLEKRLRKWRQNILRKKTSGDRRRKGKDMFQREGGTVRQMLGPSETVILRGGGSGNQGKDRNQEPTKERRRGGGEKRLHS